MKTKILKILKNTKAYISGQELCSQFNVSRTAIWKIIKQLKEEGYEIESIPNRGYLLKSCPDIITGEELQSSIETEKIGKKIKFYLEIDSTNLESKRLAGSLKEEIDGMLVIAENQKEGKGRRGRKWDTFSKEGIWMSLILKPNINPEYASMLTLITALATVRSIVSVSGLEALIKWPNDIVINGKKVCGILTEMNAELDYIHYVIIGIGINVNIKKFSDEIKEKATSLFIEGNKMIRRSNLIVLLLKEFETIYNQFLKRKDLSDIIEEYNKKLISKDRQVKIIEKEEEFVGISLGIDEKGRLLVKLPNGEIRKIFSGEVSVRGLYSYI